jgi:hypothetical protein
LLAGGEGLDDAPAAKTVNALGEVPEKIVSVVIACEVGRLVDVIPRDVDPEDVVAKEGVVASKMSANVAMLDG